MKTDEEMINEFLLNNKPSTCTDEMKVCDTVISNTITNPYVNSCMSTAPSRRERMLRSKEKIKCECCGTLFHIEPLCIGNYNKIKYCDQCTAVTESRRRNIKKSGGRENWLKSLDIADRIVNLNHINKLNIDEQIRLREEYLAIRYNNNYYKGLVKLKDIVERRKAREKSFRSEEDFDF